MTRPAFTLIEIIVVIAIIVTVSGFVIAQIQVDETKSLSFETTRISDTIESMRALSSGTNARECPAFTGSESDRVPRLESVSMVIATSNMYEVRTKCDSEPNAKVIITRKLQNGNSFQTTPESKFITLLGLNNLEIYPLDGYIDELKILSAAKKVCSCIKVLATGLPLASTSCKLEGNSYSCLY